MTSLVRKIRYTFFKLQSEVAVQYISEFKRTKPVVHTLLGQVDKSAIRPDNIDINTVSRSVPMGGGLYVAARTHAHTNTAQ